MRRVSTDAFAHITTSSSTGNGGTSTIVGRISLSAHRRRRRGGQLRGHVADVTADVLCRGEVAAVVLFRFEEHDVQLGEEEEEEGDDGAEADAQTEADDVLVGVVVDRHKGDPDDQRRVHREANELGLVEILRNVSRFDGVQCAEADEDKVKAQWGGNALKK